MNETVVPWDEAFIVMAEEDNVAVARRTLAQGTRIASGEGVTVLDRVFPAGHKIARRAIPKGDKVIRWGAPIGSATDDIPFGAHVHSHNLRGDHIPVHETEGASS